MYNSENDNSQSEKLETKYIFSQKILESFQVEQNENLINQRQLNANEAFSIGFQIGQHAQAINQDDEDELSEKQIEKLQKLMACYIKSIQKKDSTDSGQQYSEYERFQINLQNLTDSIEQEFLRQQFSISQSQQSQFQEGHQQPEIQISHNQNFNFEIQELVKINLFPINQHSQNKQKKGFYEKKMNLRKDQRKNLKTLQLNNKLDQKQQIQSLIECPNISENAMNMNCDQLCDGRKYCQICLESLNQNLIEDLILQNCTHVFHKSCVKQWTKQKIKEVNFPILCPSCNLEIHKSNIEQLITNPDEKKDYQDKLIKNYGQSNGHLSWCPNPNCKYMFEFKEGDSPLYSCQECNKSYCLDCRIPKNEGHLCQEHQEDASDDQIYEQFKKGDRFKQCIQCDLFVKRKQDQDFMKCECDYQFCYVCGLEWPHDICIAL